MKEFHVSPDSYVQMAIQLAYRRLHGFTAIYETAMTRKFYHGRTETLRSFSKQSKTFTSAMINEGATAQEKFAKLKLAIKAHKQYLNMAMDGQAPDRHLMGLRILQAENGEPQHEIFLDNSYVLSTSFFLSTSNMPGKTYFPGFGPVKIDGYGFCYAIRNNEIVAITTARHSGKGTSAQRLRDAIYQALDDIRKVVEESNKAKM